MKIVFLSNYLNHHQLPLCLAWNSMENVLFHFIATTRVPSARIALGYADMNRAYDFVVRTYDGEEQKKLALELCQDADIVITGSAREKYIKGRLDAKKLTFRYSERIYKKKPPFYEIPLRALKYYLKSGRHKNLYLLCASAYTAADYAKTGTFLGKAYKWGYFPEVKKHDDVSALIAQKKKNSLLWVARLISLKNPQMPIEVAKRLRQEGYDVELNIIGIGPLEENMKAWIIRDGLEDCVRLLGAMPAEEVRKHMEKARVFMFTSDRNEGWGAVLNESMNDGCAVVASDAIGAAPFLVNNGENGLMYRNGDVDELYQKVKFLLDHPEECDRLGTNAYTTMANVWNAETAATRLIALSEKLLQGEKRPYPYADGPCSKAPVLKDIH